MKTSVTGVRSDHSTSEPRPRDHGDLKVVDTLKQFHRTTAIAVAGTATHCSIADALHALLLGERLAFKAFDCSSAVYAGAHTTLRSARG